MIIGDMSKGGVAERFNAAHLKCVVPAKAPWVRILPPPPKSRTAIRFLFIATHPQF